MASNGFQSLFYWISRCGRACFCATKSARLSFNPCSIGLAVAAHFVLQDVDLISGFQSLFYWISRCGRSKKHSTLSISLAVSILVLLD